jgi:hypothetical protein
MNVLLESTSAIAFMGTPHAGSDIEKWGSILSSIPSIVRKTNKDIVRVLNPGSQMLATLQQEFFTMLDARQKIRAKPIKIFCFYEELGVTGIGLVSSIPSELANKLRLSLNFHADRT